MDPKTRSYDSVRVPEGEEKGSQMFLQQWERALGNDESKIVDFLVSNKLESVITVNQQAGRAYRGPLVPEARPAWFPFHFFSFQSPSFVLLFGLFCSPSFFSFFCKPDSKCSQFQSF